MPGFFRISICTPPPLRGFPEATIKVYTWIFTGRGMVKWNKGREGLAKKEGGGVRFSKRGGGGCVCKKRGAFSLLTPMTVQ